ncbi:MAG: type II methionyl aminopeptidase [Methanomicrobiaceae archaeon]|nr:type II methionyl aminopeptidase [Methanomicrobiaceae archaeon]
MIEGEILEKYLEAGRIARECRDSAAERVKEGEKILDVVVDSEEKIVSMGGGIAFPLNISLNEAAAHDTASPGDERVFKSGDVVKVDLGVHIDGYIADTAVTIDLGRNDLLVGASRAALNAAIGAVRPGVRTGEIGAMIQAEIESRGYRPVANLTGHGLGRYLLHGIPTIPNVGMQGGTELEEGMVFAIEPFASTGTGMVSDSSRTEIYSQISGRQIRLPSARKLMKKVAERNNLPFSRHWYYEEKCDLALSQLMKQNIIRGYPVLHDVPGSLVSQAEHTMVVTADGCIVTTD